MENFGIIVIILTVVLALDTVASFVNFFNIKKNKKGISSNSLRIRNNRNNISL